ncbi:hypothetical protein BGY98DRAFT_1192224 [Russula aff. rugulosa BPL654]|nr:hypothetical protein BGY98DRAFT_1192224 [Russula aff. rugulosa BPL654]
MNRGRSLLTKVLGDNESAMRGGTECLCRRPRKSDRLKLIGGHAAIFVYDLVDDEHHQLARCRRPHGRQHSRPRFTQLEFLSVCLSVHPSRKRRGKAGRDGAQGAEGNGDYFGILRWAAHEDGSAWQPSVIIMSDSGSLAGISQAIHNDSGFRN